MTDPTKRVLHLEEHLEEAYGSRRARTCEKCGMVIFGPKWGANHEVTTDQSVWVNAEANGYISCENYTPPPPPPPQPKPKSKGRRRRY